jgi:hypothetical protein
LRWCQDCCCQVGCLGAASNVRCSKTDCCHNKSDVPNKVQPSSATMCMHPSLQHTAVKHSLHSTRSGWLCALPSALLGPGPSMGWCLVQHCSVIAPSRSQPRWRQHCAARGHAGMLPASSRNRAAPGPAPLPTEGLKPLPITDTPAMAPPVQPPAQAGNGQPGGRP